MNYKVEEWDGWDPPPSSPVQSMFLLYLLIDYCLNKSVDKVFITTVNVFECWLPLRIADCEIEQTESLISVNDGDHEA